MAFQGRGEAAPRPYKADLCVRPQGFSFLNGLGADTWVRPYEGDRKFIPGSVMALQGRGEAAPRPYVLA